MTSEFDVNLARLAGKCPALWDRRSPDFLNKQKKQQLMKEIARTLNSSPNIVQVRFKSLRDRYRKEKLERLSKYGTEECDSGEEHPWPLYKELRYLDQAMFRAVNETGHHNEIIVQKMDDPPNMDQDNDVFFDFDDRLVELVANCPAIWDKKCYAYRNRTLKERAIKELAQKLNCSPKTVLERFKSLRDKYRREKIKQTLREEPQSDKDAWHLMKPLSFLDAVQVRRRVFVTQDELSRDSSTLSESDVQMDQSNTEQSNNDLSLKPGTVIQNPMKQFLPNDVVILGSSASLIDFDTKLAHLAAGCPALWDRRVSDYRNKSKKEYYINDLAKTLQCSPQLVLSRFKALREKYYREKAKMEIAGSDYEPWFLLKVLRFLDEVHFTRKRMFVPGNGYIFQSSQNSQDGCSASSSMQSENEIFVQEVTNPSTVFDLDTIQSGEIIEFLPSRDNTATSSDIDPDVNVTETKVLVGQKFETDKKEHDIKPKGQTDAHIVAFGEYLMATLRRLPSDICDETIFTLTDILKTSVRKYNASK